MARGIMTTDGRQATIVRRRSDGFELCSVGGSEFRPGERFEVAGAVGQDQAVCVFVVGRVRLGKFRARAIEVKPA